MMTVEQACEIMHDAYEEAAVTAGWETQERSRKPWADVPEANKETMRAAVRALLFAVKPEIQEQSWDEGADLAARTAVILGGPTNLPELVLGHNPYRKLEEPTT
jgi:hypothetical protein